MVKAANLSATRFVTVSNTSNQGVAVIGDVAGTTVAFGSQFEFSAANARYLSVIALSSTKFVVAYYDGSSFMAVIGDVAGTTITFGSEYVFGFGVTKSLYPKANFLGTSVTALSSTKFAVAYDPDNPGKVVIGDVAGTTISFGTTFVFASGFPRNLSMGTLSPTKIVVMYAPFPGGGAATAVIGDVAGTVITFGSETPSNAASTDNNFGAALSSTKFVMTYNDAGDSGFNTAIIGEVVETTITYGSASVFSDPRKWS